MVEVVHPRCAGMDISKTDAKVCVRIAARGKGGAKNEVTDWGATSSQVLALAGYLLGEKVTLVVMEATGQYWKPFYYLMASAGLNVMLVNPRSVRQIPGRKTDVADSMWLADLGAHGLVRPSFIAPLPIQELRDLTRTRTTLVRMRSQESQRLQDVLESAAVKLSSSISDVLGRGGRRMLEALIKGDESPAQIASGASKAFKATREELAEALTGRFCDHHAFLARQHLELVDQLTIQIEHVEARVEAYFDPARADGGPGGADPGLRADLAAKRDLLTTIPGVGRETSEKILAEIGPDMSAFPTADHLASWAGLAPGLNQSAGKSKKSKRRPGNKSLQGALGTAALSIIRNQPNTFFHARYRRVASRRGHARALVATQRAMLIAVYRILTTGQPYQDPGADYYKRRRPSHTIRRAIEDLKAVGCNVTITADLTYAIT
jgi:transposase